jgi:hypothetical protein
LLPIKPRKHKAITQHQANYENMTIKIDSSTIKIDSAI